MATVTAPAGQKSYLRSQMSAESGTSKGWSRSWWTVREPGPWTRENAWSMDQPWSMGHAMVHGPWSMVHGPWSHGPWPKNHDPWSRDTLNRDKQLLIGGAPDSPHARASRHRCASRVEHPQNLRCFLMVGIKIGCDQIKPRMKNMGST